MASLFKKLVGLDNKKNQNINNQENIEDESAGQAEGDNYEEADQNLEPEKSQGEEWIDEEYEEGQLSIDVYQTPRAIIIKSTIAGVKPEDIDISINNGMLTIRGKREEKEMVNEDDYLYRECYWGSFSRSIILPLEVEAEKIEAVLENGVLTVTLPKAKITKQISVKVKEK